MRKLLVALVLLSGCLDTGVPFYPFLEGQLEAVKAYAPAVVGAVGVPPTDPVIVAFNGKVDAASIVATIDIAGVDVGPLSEAVNDRIAEFMPAMGFLENTTYTFNLTQASVEGNLPLVPLTLTFTTGIKGTVTTNRQIQTILAGSCTLVACHADASVSGLDLSGDVTPQSLNKGTQGGCGDPFTCTAFSDLMLTCAGPCDATRMSWAEAVPGAPCESCIMFRLRGGSMPLSFPYNLNPLTTAQVDRIEQWILNAK